MPGPSPRPAVTLGALIVAALGVPIALRHATVIARAYARPAPPVVVAPVSRCEPSVAPVIEPVQTEPARLEARWGSSWYPITPIADVCTGFVRFRFDGYGEEWDSVVRTGDLRVQGSTSQGLMPTVETSADDPEVVDHIALPAGHRLRAGEPVMIEWQGSWWPGRVVALRSRGARVTYDGYDASSDEEVTRARLGLRVTRRDEPIVDGETLAGSLVGRPVGDEPLVVGQRVIARQGPRWLRARVTGLACGALVSVHYAGRDASFDEFVSRDRLQIEAPRAR